MYLYMFMQTLSNPPRPKLHLFVCINDRTRRAPDMASCAPEVTAETVKQVKLWILQNGLVHDVLITKSGCLGICPQEGGIMVLYPKGKWVTGIKGADDIIAVIQEELAAN